MKLIKIITGLNCFLICLIHSISVCAYVMPPLFELSDAPGFEHVQSNKDVYGLIGDTDINNRINIKDATLIQKNIAHLVAFSEKQTVISNVNFDAGINIKDATAIQKWCASLKIKEPINYLLYYKHNATDPTIESTVFETNPDLTKYSVIFNDYDGTVLKTDTVESGKAAIAPATPYRSGYTFCGWDKNFDIITEDTTVTAMYERIVTPTILIGDASGKAGETVIVDVSIVNNPGLFGAILTYQFETALTLTDAKAGLAFDALDVSFPKYDSPFTVFCDGLDKPAAEDGIIMSFEFVIPSDATVGQTYEITASYLDGDIVDSNFEDVGVEIVSGELLVEG